MLATLGDVMFFSSSFSTQTFDNLKGKVAQRYAIHEMLNTKPKLQNLGSGLKEFSLDVKFSKLLGLVDPVASIQKLDKMREDGEVVFFSVGTTVVGRFVITSLEDAWKKIALFGAVLSIDCSISIQEYN